jgi:hypothetical protein
LGSKTNAIMFNYIYFYVNTAVVKTTVIVITKIAVNCMQ